MTREEHDAVFTQSSMSIMLGAPSQAFLDQHWSKVAKDGVCNVSAKRLKAYVDKRFAELKPGIMNHLNITEN